MKKCNQKTAHHHPILLMGCGFVLTAVHENKQIAWDALLAAETEIRRIETLISSWKPNSQTSKINDASGIGAVSVDKELFDLIARSVKVSELTCGAFDISGTLARYYWKFDKKDHSLLPDQKIRELISLVNYRNIKLDAEKHSVFLTKKNMKIGFGGIGKGYAAECAKNIMQAFGIESGLVNASGDLLAWGNPPSRDDWEISVPDPRDRSMNLLSLYLEYGSVVIVCPNAEFGDALATALSVLPIDEGINLVDRLEGVECIIIDAFDVAHFSNQLNQKAYA